MVKRSMMAVAITALAVSALLPYAHRARAQRAEQGPAQDVDLKNSSAWMKHKLVASKEILEGLTRGDFAQIAKNARTMQDVSFLEGWVRADVPGYRTQLHTFNFANGAIIDAAEAKNIDGVTLAYTQLTISCVQCHKIVRDKTKE